tara:strand:- start:766 stop:1233 length:468 start_codon:yes stop_codon:yes gene_type:complete
MKCTFDDVIAQAPINWDSDLMSLSDELKDLAVYSWFKAHPSWINDYLPEAVYGLEKTMIKVLYEDSKSFEAILNARRSIYSEKHDIPAKGNEDVFYSSSALGDFETLCTDAAAFLDDSNIGYADMLKELIYLNLESTLREKLFDAQGLEETSDYN